MDILIDPAVTERATGKLKITNARAVQPTTVTFISQPNLPRLNRPFIGKYLASRCRHSNSIAGKEKEMSSARMPPAMNTLNAEIVNISKADN